MTGIICTVISHDGLYHTAGYMMLGYDISGNEKTFAKFFTISFQHLQMIEGIEKRGVSELRFVVFIHPE